MLSISASAQDAQHLCLCLSPLRAVQVEKVYAIKCAGAEAKYAPFKRLKNRMLLWKGARESSMASILAQGLHVPAPETPSASYPFGIAKEHIHVCVYIYLSCSSAFTLSLTVSLHTH